MSEEEDINLANNIRKDNINSRRYGKLGKLHSKMARLTCTIRGDLVEVLANIRDEFNLNSYSDAIELCIRKAFPGKYE